MRKLSNLEMLSVRILLLGVWLLQFLVAVIFLRIAIAGGNTIASGALYIAYFIQFFLALSFLAWIVIKKNSRAESGARFVSMESAVFVLLILLAGGFQVSRLVLTLS